MRRMIGMVLAVTTAFGTSAALASVSGPIQLKRVPHELPQASEARQVEITTLIRRVVVIGKAGGVWVTARGALPARVTWRSTWILSRPTVRHNVRRGVLYLEGRCRHGRNCGTYFTVRVPARVAVEVREDAADVNVYGAPGNVLVDTDVGDVRVNVSRAPIRINTETDTGDVRVSVPRGSYAVETDTDFGFERIRGLDPDEEATRSIRAVTDIGDVTVEAR